jgi:DNA-binding MarR family transcriptional regulator
VINVVSLLDWGKTSVEEQKLFELNLLIWLQVADLNHKMFLIRNKELSKHCITTRQIHILRLIEALGKKATLSVIAKATERKLDVISRQAVGMEKEGLIKRIRVKPKSRLLKLELTDKGRELLKISRFSDGMNEISSILTEEELKQLHAVLDRLLTKLKQYDPAIDIDRLF